VLARDQRGVVFPSPVVILSILAVAMAGVAWVATRNPTPTERQVTPAAVTHNPSAHHSAYSPPKPKHDPKPSGPQVDRGKVVVEVFNNSSVSGLAGRVAGQAAHAGWQVVGSDNWYGTIPASTVYYPARLREQATLLGKDLGIGRLRPMIAPMRGDRLTVILTSDYS
jgi:hypothetical protein